MTAVRNGIFKLVLALSSGLALPGSCQTGNAGIGDDGIPFREPIDLVSTKWMEEARVALPGGDFAKGSLSFEETTNLLCLQGRRGNIVAKGLYGFALLVQNRSPEEAKTGLKLIRSSADYGDVSAMFNLGLLYAGGKYVGTNYEEAFHWFSLAADKGNSGAELQLGTCWYYGFGTTRDLAMAAKCYRLSAERTNYVAMKCLGYMLSGGRGVARDLEAARYWYLRAAKEGGDRRAMYNLGVLCNQGETNANARAQAFQWYKQSAELNDPLACAALADCYHNGWGVAVDADNYYSWRSKAASLGATAAQFAMGDAGRDGDGLPRDMERALAWYRKAAAKNHPYALYNLALYYNQDKTNLTSLKLASDCMLLAAQAGHREAQFQYALSCFRGDLTPPDVENGKRWLAKAGENGWARAEVCLFKLYYHGDPPAPKCPPYPQDKVEAVKWLRRAVGRENVEAETILAVMLIHGLEMEPNKGEAEKLLRHAAEHGYAPAQNELGAVILNGDTGQRDLVESAIWLRLGLSHLNDPKLLPSLNANLTRALSQLTEAEKREVDDQVKSFQAIPVAIVYPTMGDWEENPNYLQEDRHLGR